MMQDEITNWSHRLRWLTIAVAVLIPVSYAYTLIWGDPRNLLSLPTGVSLYPEQLDSTAWISIALIGLLKPLSFLPALWCLFRLSGLYQDGEVFSLRTTGYIRATGWWLIFIDIAFIAISLVRSLVLSLLGLADSYIAVELGLSFSIVGVFTLLIARIMMLAQTLKEESDLTI